MAIVIPATVMAALLIAYNYQREKARLVRDQIATARTLMQAIDRELASVQAAAEVLSTSPWLQRGDLATFYTRARSAMERQIGANVVLSDAEGRELMNTLRPLGERLPQHGNPDQLRAVFASAHPVISNIYRGVLNQPVMSIDVPVVRDGQVVYDLSIGLLPDRFIELLRDPQLPADWIAVVYDGNGTIVARNRDPERFVGKPGAPDLVELIRELREGSLERRTPSGVAVLSVFTRSDVSNWAVALAIPSQSLTAELWRSLGWVTLGAIVLLLSSLAVAWVIGGRISRAIHALTLPALDIGLGKVVTVPALQLKEADEVGQALMRASALLRDAQHRADHDALTGLPNRSLFMEAADHQLTVCRDTGNALAVLYIDFDGFKSVNDRHGHGTGDELLREIAARLRNAIRGFDLAARLGGDEFAVLLVGLRSDAAGRVAGELVDVLSLPYPIGRLALQLSASIGVAEYPASGTTIEALVASADRAMYQAKAAGKGCAVVAGAA